MRRIGFVGIGNMGWPMAANLLEAGYDVSVADANAERVASFAREVGGRGARDVRDAAAGAEVVVTMLPTSSHVAEVLRELVPVLVPGTVAIDMSSGAPTATQALAAELAEVGVTLVDCPVSGGVPRAVTGELTLMLGGADEVVERVMPILRAMGNAVRHCGATGSGHAMKALNNLVSAGGFLVGIEALLIGARFGLERERMVEILNVSTGANNSTQRKFSQFVLSGTFDSGFGLDLMAKDLAIALDLARSGAVVAPFSSVCQHLWASAANVLGPGRDHTEMARFAETVAGFGVS